MLKAMKLNSEFPQKILDVGIGPGASLKYIIDDIPNTTKIVGIDYNPLYIASAKDKFKNF